ncbi:hypothetical protein ACFWPQ_08245 [Streptomyces sp. NPDC058464]|uniref:hypothetical protein n=1 Tax=Streptomyces sp. NPDC058464 TaxID=3346511 RepID=UPI003665ABE8
MLFEALQNQDGVAVVAMAHVEPAESEDDAETRHDVPGVIGSHGGVGHGHQRLRHQKQVPPLKQHGVDVDAVLEHALLLSAPVCFFAVRIAHTVSSALSNRRHPGQLAS